MKIGIDAKWLFAGPPSGRRVVRSLVESLGEVAGDDEIHLFLDARSRDELSSLPSDRRHYVWAENNQLANVFVVPRVADRLRLDAVVYQNFVPPRVFARHARIAFVFDAIFATHAGLFTWYERLYFAPMRRLSRSADRVCTISKTERARLVGLEYASADRIDVVPLAIDRSLMSRAVPGATVRRVLERLGVRAPYVLYVGRVNVRKNLPVLIRAMPLVHSALSLVIAGAADSTCGDLAQIATAVGVADRVRLLGTVSDDDLRSLYAEATVFCYPSLDEGFGLPPLEAMAFGVPVVVSDIPSLRETCGEAGVYVNPANVAEVAAGIDSLVSGGARRGRLVDAGRRRAKEFCWDSSARQLLATVHAAVESRA